MPELGGSPWTAKNDHWQAPTSDKPVHDHVYTLEEVSGLETKCKNKAVAGKMIQDVM